MLLFRCEYTKTLEENVSPMRRGEKHEQDVPRRLKAQDG